ncbi:MAG TPA: hypothetical protein VE398_06040 [Acidobacteriota bacterium]|nr:hypothetical protein [Acidobacteriota bacterium]
MKREIVRRMKLLATALVLAVSVPVAMAGPPLLCHIFNIGNAKSLPWSAGEKDWNTPSADYDTRHLVEDTVAILTDSAPVIVRMETIRRATLYCGKDPTLGAALLGRFKTLATGGEQKKRDALRLFDYGYLVETMKQGSITRELKDLARTAGSLDGYSFIQEALQARGNDPEMEFAAALATLWPKNEHHQEHFRKAVAGAAGDSLLAANLLNHFPDRGKTLAELRSY